MYGEYVRGVTVLEDQEIVNGVRDAGVTDEMKNCMKSWDDSLEYLDTSNNNYDEEEDVITLVMEHGQYSVPKTKTVLNLNNCFNLSFIVCLAELRWWGWGDVWTNWLSLQNCLKCLCKSCSGVRSSSSHSWCCSNCMIWSYSINKFCFFHVTPRINTCWSSSWKYDPSDCTHMLSDLSNSI